MKVNESCRVSLNYSIHMKDGQLVDKNPDGEPLEFVTGQEEVIPALEKGIMGMETGESRTFDVGPDEAFGQRDPEAVRVVKRTDLVDGGNDLEEGMIFRIKDDDGNSLIITVLSMDDEEAVFDLNHPLAGAPLTFDVQIIEVNGLR